MTHAQENKPKSTEYPHEITPRAPGPNETVPGSVHGTVEPPTSVSSPPPSSKIKRTRISGTWIAVVIALLVLVFLLIFILQNLDTATVNFLGFSGSLPLAVAMLFATIAGGLLVALIGAARIFQLRKETRKARKALR